MVCIYYVVKTRVPVMVMILNLKELLMEILPLNCVRELEFQTAESIFKIPSNIYLIG